MEVHSLELNNYYEKPDDGFEWFEQTVNREVGQPDYFRCEQDSYWIPSNSENISIKFYDH